MSRFGAFTRKLVSAAEMVDAGAAEAGWGGEVPGAGGDTFQ